MHYATIKTNGHRGFGYTRQDDAVGNIWFHAKDSRNLSEDKFVLGRRVPFEIWDTQDSLRAANIQLLE